MRFGRFGIPLPHSLKFRLIAVLLLAAVIPVSLIGGISYYTIYNLLSGKLEKGIHSTLNQEKTSLDATLSNLDYASQQLALIGDIRNRYEAYIHRKDPLERSEIEKDVYKYTTIVNYTNPDLGFMSYYLPDDGSFLFSNMNVNPELHILQFPRIATPYAGLEFLGPHRTLYPYSDNTVLSVLRTVGGGAGEKRIAVYIETNFKVFSDRLSRIPYGLPIKHVLLNAKGEAVYSEQMDVFPLNRQADLKRAKGRSYFASGEDVVFAAEGKAGWTLLTVIARKEFFHETNEWIARFAAVGLLSIGASLLLAWFIWRTIYRPLVRLNRYLQHTAATLFNEPIRKTGVTEFDELLGTFGFMKGEIVGLLKEIELKERNKRDLEVEKLLYQINPHFIHNTLNTVQWLAKMNGQRDIFELVSYFIEVLDYNLGKEGKVVTIRQELKAVGDYVSLQRIRYQHAFRVDFEVEDDTLDIPFPRFLLQPLVENALYHGFHNKDGFIRVTIAREKDGFVCVRIADNGEGMSQEKRSQLFDKPADAAKKAGLGIGLAYVQNTIRSFYGEQYGMQVESEPGVGTTITMRLPDETGGEL
ncbi:two-component system, sensor histidine kinase YesM [Paenibacillus sp. UNC496MF]|uniref:sensor histidine kinase n=1 Tax=Paenibacillus sp. UNC496MF TaxID=1502753 RepID=UPI0008E4A60F|nr:histidine kinase [Paenibacillus sp. UNC496MF]SFJ31295.1 two-component system, sensor histidine kinase YesM [Paenibacillus sp. UNC496MF]